MKTQKRKMPFLPGKKARMIIILSMIMVSRLSAQNNTSYTANTTPISGVNCVAVGKDALLNSESEGSSNVAIGYEAMKESTDGSFNVAVGWGALRTTTTGADDTAIGYGALYAADNGFGNTAVGSVALNNNTSGGENTGVGTGALWYNHSGLQ